MTFKALALLVSINNTVFASDINEEITRNINKFADELAKKGWKAKNPEKPTYGYEKEGWKVTPSCKGPEESIYFDTIVATGHSIQHLECKKNNETLVRVSFRSWHEPEQKEALEAQKLRKEDFHKFNEKRLRDIEAFISDNFYICSKIETLGPFLKLFYDYKLVPDFVVDVMLPYFQTDDFRITPENFVVGLYKNLSENHSKEEFKTALFENLNRVKDQKRHDTVIWTIAKELKDSDIIKTLYELIRPESEHYSQAQTLLASMSIAEFADKTTLVERYKTPIMHHLCLSHEISEKNTLIKAFINNGRITTESLPSELQNLSASSEADAKNIFNLLNYIRKLQNPASE